MQPTETRNHLSPRPEVKVIRVRQDQLDSIRDLGVIPSLFPMHTFYWGDWYDQITSGTRANRA